MDKILTYLVIGILAGGLFTAVAGAWGLISAQVAVWGVLGIIVTVYYLL